MQNFSPHLSESLLQSLKLHYEFQFLCAFVGQHHQSVNQLVHLVVKTACTLDGISKTHTNRISLVIKCSQHIVLSLFLIPERNSKHLSLEKTLTAGLRSHWLRHSCRTLISLAKTALQDVLIGPGF